LRHTCNAPNLSTYDIPQKKIILFADYTENEEGYELIDQIPFPGYHSIISNIDLDIYSHYYFVPSFKTHCVIFGSHFNKIPHRIYFDSLTNDSLDSTLGVDTVSGLFWNSHAFFPGDRDEKYKSVHKRVR
jgi:hypothetical protein